MKFIIHYLPIFMMIFSLAGEELPLEKLLYHDDNAQVLQYKKVNELVLRLHHYRPQGAAKSEKLPTLMVIHGGGWSAPGPENMRHLCQYLASRGMMAVNIEYRLVSKDNNIRISDCMEDARDALAYLQLHADELGVDAMRIAVAGGSAGGHLAATLALSMGFADTSTKAPAAAILYNPVLDLTTIPWIKNHPGVAAKSDSPVEEDWQERARKVSPMLHVKSGLPPIMIIHGSDDGVVDVKQVDQFKNSLLKLKNKVVFNKMKGWGHAFIVPNYGSNEQVVRALQLTDEYLEKLGWLQGKPTIAGPWQPDEYHQLFTTKEAQQAHVKAKSHTFYDFPFLDGQWQGILTDSDDNTWFSISSHSGIHHGQVFRYNPRADRVDHIADLGQVCGEKLLEASDQVPEGKIHSNMFEDGDVIYCATTDAHRLHEVEYTGGYWLAIHKKTGVIENLGKTITGDGLLCAGYDPYQKLMYVHTNVKGLLTRFNPITREEKILGFPYEGSDLPWPRGLCLMFTKDGRIYGGRPPRCSFWEYDPASEKFRIFRPEMPDPLEIKENPTDKMKDQWEKSGLHLSLWNEKDQCFYFVRSFDEMLMRLVPPKIAGGEAKVEALYRLRPPGLEMRYENRAASCTLVIHDRTVYYTPGTGWGGVTYLVSYQLDSKEYKHYGPIICEGNRRVNEVHSMSVGKDGKLYMVAFVFSIKNVDPIRPYAMRDKYPFHPRFLIIDPSKDCKPTRGEAK